MKMHRVSIGEIMKNVTLEVELKLTQTRWYAFRMWLGVQIIRLATRVIGCGVEFKVPPTA